MSDQFVKVEITAAEKSRLKIVWGYGRLDFLPYFVDVDFLKRLANGDPMNEGSGLEGVRPALQHFVGMIRKGNRAQIADALRRVAIAGRALYDALFLSDEHGGDDPEDIRDWLESLQGRVEVLFSVDARVHIPWGLMYDGDVDAVPADGVTPDAYANFWCLRYDLATVYSRLKPTGLEAAADPQYFGLAAVVNQRVLDAVLAAVSDPTEQDAWQRIVTEARALTASKAELFQAWLKSRDTIGVLYFLCHANGTRLVLSEDDELSIDQFRLELRRKSRLGHPPCLVVINGCLTATGSDAGGFLEATSGNGFCGFVGTEAKIPDVFAFRFGRDLVGRLLLNGETPGGALRELRLAHWPLSLVYQLYGYPVLRANVAQPTFQPVAINYSDGPLGSSDI